MTTLAALKAEIASDLDRTDLTTQIATAITAGIRHYKPRRFYFNESRTITFDTVADQDTYTSSDQVSIPLLFDFDLVTVDVDDDIRDLMRMEHSEIEVLNDANSSTGEPVGWAYFNQSFRLYPIPDAAYTIRIIGGIKTAAPATDVEANNVWMTEAYELLHCYAKRYLATHVVRDAEMMATMAQAERSALDLLIEETSKKKARGKIRATTF